MRYILLLLVISVHIYGQSIAYQDKPVLTGNESLFSVYAETPVFWASTYYVATNGADNNPGNITQPFATIGKLNSVLHAGDIAYIRGGTYNPVNTPGASAHYRLDGLTGSAIAPIQIWAYPTETVILSCGNITPTYADPTAMYIVDCSYIHVKGIHVTYLKQIASGLGESRGITLWNTQHSTFEWMEVDNIGGTGWTIENHSNDNLLLNCDSHHNGDGLSPGGQQWNNSDGFQCSTGGDLSTRNTYRFCRAWLNADDGWDKFNSNAEVHFEGCWSMWNGVKPWGISNTQVTPGSMTASSYAWHGNSGFNASSGEGFKMGPANTQNLTLLTTYASNCVSFENRGTGYAANSDAAKTNKHQYYNCIAYKNDNDGFSYGSSWSVGCAQQFKNNWSFDNNKAISGADFVYDGLCTAAISNDVWMTVSGPQGPCGNLAPGVSVSTADFVSVSSTQMAGARQSNGALPVVTFLNLVSGSDLRGAGVEVGYGTDIGAFQFGGSPPPTADAGPDKALVLPVNSVSMTGIATGSSPTYAWTLASGPNTPTLTNGTTLTASVSGLIQGTYKYYFTVTSAMQTARDSMNIVVSNTGQIETNAIMRQVSLWNGHFILDITYEGVQTLEVERSVGTGGFASMGTVTYKTSQTGYGFIDWLPVKGNNSYRIKTGKVYSPVVIKKKQ